MYWKSTPQEGIYAWYCKPGQKPVAEAVIGPKGETKTLVLLNGHGDKRLCKCYGRRKGLFSTLIRDASLVMKCRDLWLLKVLRTGNHCILISKEIYVTLSKA